MKSHDFESFVSKTIDINYQEALKVREELPVPIEKFRLWSDQGSRVIGGMVIESKGVYKEVIHYEVPDADFLESDYDDLMEDYCEKWDLEIDEYCWGDYYNLPESLYRMEMIKASKEIVKKLKKEGIKFSKSADVGILIEDEWYDDIEDFRSVAFESLLELPKKSAIREFLEMFYAKKKTVDKLLKELKKWQQAEEDAKRIDFPDNIDAILEKGIEFTKSLKHGESIPYFEKVLELDPNHIDGLSRLARAYVLAYGEENKKKGIEAYNKLIEQIGPKDYIYYNLGHAYKGLKDYDEAIVCYKKAGELDLEEKYYAPYYIGELYYSDKEDYAKAITFFKEALSIKPDHENTLTYLYLIYEDKKDYDEAIACALKILEIKPDGVYAVDNVLSIIKKYIENNALDKAYESYQKFQKENIDSEDYPDIISGLRELGDAFIDKEEYKKAIDLYLQGIDFTPDNYVLYNEIGYCYDVQDDYENAVSYYKKSVEIEPNFLTGWDNLGYVISRQGKFDLALPYYKKVLEIDDRKINSYVNLGDLLIKLDKLEESKTYLEKGLEVSPEAPLLNLLLGHIYLIKGKESKAIDCYKKSLANSETTEEFIENAREDIATLGKHGILEEKYLSIINTIK